MVREELTPKDCRTCKSYRDCLGKEWYSYNDIRWCPYQVMWLLENSESMRSGRWPSQHINSGYTDEPVKRRTVRPEAYYAKTVGIIAELQYRIMRTGLSGKLLVAQVKAGDSIDNLEPEASCALMYIKGWRRKRISYSLWLAQGNYYKKYSKSRT